MKSQREIYEALCSNKTLKYESQNVYVLARFHKDGYLETSYNKSNIWEKAEVQFNHLPDWQIYIEPKKPMTLEVEVQWWDDNGENIIFPRNSEIHLHTKLLKPFIGKRTKMTLVEIVEMEEK